MIDVAYHVNVVSKCLRRLTSIDSCVSGATKAAAMLVELAMARGSQDNISVVIVKLDDFAYITSYQFIFLGALLCAIHKLN